MVIYIKLCIICLRVSEQIHNLEMASCSTLGQYIFQYIFLFCLLGVWCSMCRLKLLNFDFDFQPIVTKFDGFIETDNPRKIV